MTNAALAERIKALERQVAQIMEKVISPPVERDWRSTIGMFYGDPLMQEIDEAGRKIRESDREQAADDRPRH